MIRVLIADDSPTFREWLRYTLKRDPEIVIVGEAVNGSQAIELARKKQPDIITMDIHMPEMDGYEAIAQIMEKHPIPIIVLSSAISKQEISASFKALEAGAIAVLGKPSDLQDNSKLEEDILLHIKSLSRVNVVRRRTKKNTTELPKSTPIKDSALIKGLPEILEPFELIVMGGSAGGPQAIQSILKDLPHNLSIPILITMHISKGFIESFSDWLSRSTQLQCKVAEHGEIMQAGIVYLAADNAHLLPNSNHILNNSNQAPVDNFKPSITAMFEAAASQFGAHTLGILLTGMGKDGARGLKKIKDAGGYTIAQDKTSSMIFSMPKSAIEMNAAIEICHLDHIAGRILNLLESKK
ncbi:MAG: chemotaxis-specific protein-glutamate methyltransferase CheB [Anaerolineaceae bacterium]|nr:chemotaxis-specific protein-glutamate methyltransferase CheB [Anaerolineaceae bacterium]